MAYHTTYLKVKTITVVFFRQQILIPQWEPTFELFLHYRPTSSLVLLNKSLLTSNPGCRKIPFSNFSKRWRVHIGAVAKCGAWWDRNLVVQATLLRVPFTDYRGIPLSKIFAPTCSGQLRPQQRDWWTCIPNKYSFDSNLLLVTVETGYDLKLPTPHNGTNDLYMLKHSETLQSHSNDHVSGSLQE